MTIAAPPATEPEQAPGRPVPVPASASASASALTATALLAVAVLAATLASLAFGSNPISLSDVIGRLLNPASDEGAIVWGSRVPRTILGLGVGAALGVAGAVMQGQTRNPLADPGLFGVSAGAALAVVVGVRFASINSVLGMLWLAMAGAILASIVVFGVAALGRGLASPVPLAIAGTAVSALLVALTSFIVLSDSNTLAAYRVWVVGSLSGRNLEGTIPALLIGVVGLALALANTRALDSLALGAELAAGLGLNIVRARLVGLGAITALTAASVALTGPIGFIGLTAPHLARALVGSTHARLLPAAGLIGAASLLICDVIGRIAAGTDEIAVGMVLAVIGGVAFVLIVRRGRTAQL